MFFLDPMDYSPPGSTYPGILQYIWHSILLLLSPLCSFLTPWTVAHQTPLTLEFSSQKYWNGFPFPSPGDLPNPGIKPGSPALQADFYHLSHQGSPDAINTIQLSSDTVNHEMASDCTGEGLSPTRLPSTSEISWKPRLSVMILTMRLQIGVSHEHLPGFNLPKRLIVFREAIYSVDYWFIAKVSRG